MSGAHPHQFTSEFIVNGLHPPNLTWWEQEYCTKFRADAMCVAKIRLEVRFSSLGNHSTQSGIETELLV